MVGPTYAKRLAKLEIRTVEDLLYHFPHRYEDTSRITKIGNLKAGEPATIIGSLVSARNIFTRSSKRLQKALIADDTGQIEATWFNQPYLVKTLQNAQHLALSGIPNFFGHQLTFSSPEYEILSRKEAQQIFAGRSGQANSLAKTPIDKVTAEVKPLRPKKFQLSGYRPLIHTGRLVPIYPETYGVSSKWLRSRLAPLLKEVDDLIIDWLPKTIQSSEKLEPLSTSLKEIHFPTSAQAAEKARKRLAFDELFLLQLASQKRKFLWLHKKLSHPLTIDQNKILEFIGSLPFTLTPAQTRSIKEILDDLQRHVPMNRLLQGDVGSGKTVVAAIAAYATYRNGLKTILLAPTEILAQQHLKTLSTVFANSGATVELITSSSSKLLKAKSYKLAANITVGTHALLFRDIPENLGLLVVDEQHRFGVEQRAKLLKAPKTPHLLSMTATPIPRTTALTVYGELDLSIIDEQPRGRKKVKTWVVPAKKRTAAYEWIESEIAKYKTQAFIVCPLIKESEAESLSQVKAAQEEYEHLKQNIFPHLQLGLLHGRMKSKEKDAVIQAFRQKSLDILVSTPVIEVGIDIPNATVIVIEAAERFGLAQLHQLRGRVGRGDRQSYCLLFPSIDETTALDRLKAMEKHHSGFTLAEIDLKLRGPGEMYGLKQHGFTRLKVASFSDHTAIAKTHHYAKKLIATDPELIQSPLLKQKLDALLTREIEPN